MNTKNTGRQINRIQNDIFGAMVVITISMTLLTSTISILANIYSEKKSIDNNLRNIAYTISQSSILKENMRNSDTFKSHSVDYLDSIKSSISNVDVISVISNKGERLYHTNKSLVGTTYDGTIPDFSNNGNIYITNDVGPSGAQRRVYAAIYDNDGVYKGFALIVILSQNINKLIVETILIHSGVALIIIIFAVILSDRISKRIKHKLLGYEPDAFSAMYSVRDNILESFEEGIIAIDYNEKILFMNKAAQIICDASENYSLNLKDYPMLSIKDVRKVLKTNEKITGVQARTMGNIDAIINYYPVNENEKLIGVICVLTDRTEYTKIAEDLSGVKFLVESMRANNHDFTNKLHVILGLVQMGANKEAVEYISNVTSIQQETISKIMRNIDDPSIAALIIGKYSKASELNISFSIEAGSSYKRSDVDINSGDLVTVIGNLIENAFDAINMSSANIKEVSLGIFTKPGALLVRVDDSGLGIPENIQRSIYENGITSKGMEHGTGLFVVKQIIDRYNGSISFETEENVGTSFTVTLVDDNGGNINV